MGYLKLGTGAVVVTLLAGCTTAVPYPSAPRPVPLPPSTGQLHFGYVPPALVQPSRSLLQIYAKKVWPKQEQMDQVLVIACVRHTAYQLQHTDSGWVYAGSGKYRKTTPKLAKAPACWDGLAKVFENQERGAMAALGDRSAMVRQYYRNSTSWALYCEGQAITESGLKDCLSPQALSQVRVDRKQISEAFD